MTPPRHLLNARGVFVPKTTSTRCLEVEFSPAIKHTFLTTLSPRVKQTGPWTVCWISHRQPLPSRVTTLKGEGGWEGQAFRKEGGFAAHLKDSHSVAMGGE